MANIHFPCFEIKSYLQFCLTVIEDKSQKCVRSHFAIERRQVGIYNCSMALTGFIAVTPDNGRQSRSELKSGACIGVSEEESSLGSSLL